MGCAIADGNRELTTKTHCHANNGDRDVGSVVMETEWAWLENCQSGKKIVHLFAGIQYPNQGLKARCKP